MSQNTVAHNVSVWFVLVYDNHTWALNSGGFPNAWYNLCFFSLDSLLRGEKLPGPLVWVHQRLLWNHLPPEPMQLLQGGEWDVHGLRPAQLHGPAVPPDQGRVPRVSEYHRLQWLHSVLPHRPCGKYEHNITMTWAWEICLVAVLRRIRWGYWDQFLFCTSSDISRIV